MPFDVIVVGGGPAGLSAALMLGRCRRRVLLCDLGEPRNRRTRALHGYLTRDGIPPLEFNALGRSELTPYGVQCRHIGVHLAERLPDGFEVCLTDGSRERARFLLLATGVIDELPDIPGLSACYGTSAFHCPYCDGWEWQERRLAVIGRGPNGGQLALSMITWSPDVVLLTNGRRVAPEIRRRLERNGVRLRTEPVAGLEHQDGMLQAVTFVRGEPIERDALFFSTGQHARSALAGNLGCHFTHRGTVRTGTLGETNETGIFVAGDASRDAQFVVVAAAEGVKAAMAINQALQRQELKA
jgi:thioredoxin reductase